MSDVPEFLLLHLFSFLHYHSFLIFLSLELPVCGKRNSSICLYLQSTQSSWLDAFKSCENQGGQLLNFSIDGTDCSDLTDYVLNLMPDRQNTIWTSGRTNEKKWHWISGMYFS